MSQHKRQGARRNGMRLATIAGSCAMAIVTAAPVRAAEDTLTVATFSIPAAMGNVYRSTSASELYVWAATFDPLTLVDGKGQVQPWLALRWEAPTPRTWRFHLRPGVRFSNGEPFTADAVVTALSYLTSPAGARESVSRIVTSIATARAIDDLTIEIDTHYPNIMLPAELALVRLAAPGQWRRLGPEGFARAPVGTGPFAVARWTASTITYTAVPDAWNPPKTAGLRVVKLSDTTARVQAVLAGQADLALVVAPDDVATLRAAGHDGMAMPGTGAMGLAFLPQTEGPLADRRVRLALNYAVDKQRYIDALLAGATRPTSQAAPSFAIGFDPTLAPFPPDPAKARALLQEAGYGDGFEIVGEAVFGGSSNDAAIYQYVAQDLAAVGVRLTMRNIPVAELIKRVNFGGWQGQAYNIDFNVKPSLDALRAFHECLIRPAFHCRPDMVPLIRDAQAEFDLPRRTSRVQALLKRLHDDPPMLYLHETVMFDGLHRRLRGYRPVNQIINYHGLEVAN